MGTIAEVQAQVAVHHPPMAAQPRRILVGFDGSEGAQRALTAAAEVMGYGSTLTVVSVAPSEEPATPDPLAAARGLLLDRLVQATYVRRVGDAAGELVALADELGADLVVVGRRGHEGSRKPRPGSVSADVVRHTARDVLVVS